MANYSNSRGNSRFGGNNRKPPFNGDNRGGRPDFARKSWGDKRSDDRPITMHKATCAECGKPCEVPFRPSGDKPVYCRECFANKEGGDGGRGRDRFPKKDFSPRSQERPSFENKPSSDVVVKQLEAVNTKLERLIRAVEILAHKSSDTAPETNTVSSEPIKKAKKKRSTK